MNAVLPSDDRVPGPAQAPDGLAGWISPGRSALLVIDMQIDFASPDGVLGQAGIDLSAVPPALKAAERLASTARSSGAPVVFIGLQTSAEADSPAWAERMRRRGGNPDSDSNLCREGTAGADFIGPIPDASDTVVAKRRFSGFFHTDLDARLRRLGVDTLVVCGLTTECCVDCTVRDAFHLDYHVFIAGDACASHDPALHEGALRSLELNCAIIASTDEIIAAWTGAD